MSVCCVRKNYKEKGTYKGTKDVQLLYYKAVCICVHSLFLHSFFCLSTTKLKY